MRAEHGWPEVGAPPATVARTGDAAGNLVAIGLVLLFGSAVGWAITGGPSISVLPFGWQPQPTDLLLPLGLVAGLICIVGGIVGSVASD